MNVQRLLALLLCLIGGFSITSAVAQDDSSGSVPRTSSVPVSASTRLEAFLHQAGAVIVEGYTDVGTVNSDDNGTVRVLAIELTNAAAQQKLYGIGIEVHREATNNDDSPRTALAFVDENEIDPLLEGMNTIQRLDATVTTLAAFNARYRTHGDLELESRDTDGARSVAIRTSQVLHPSGEITWATVIVPIARMADVREHITTAKQLLDRAKAK